MSPKVKGVTIKILLEHMQNMQRVILDQMHSRFGRVENRIGLVEQRLGLAEQRLLNAIAGDDTMEARITEIELEVLPKRVLKLEKAVFGKR